ncbi:MAG: hypothetical protein RJB34_1244 [Pseudomonadota bacterium]
MFERPHHQRIAHILAALDGNALAQHGCWFGGGTCIALRFGEYRESVDMDFLVSDATGYRELRQLLTGIHGLAPVTRPGAIPLELVREMRADQYGLRTQVQMDGHAIKFEIVREARITLQAPSAQDQICGIGTLTVLDMAASKLLAKAIDRLQNRQGWLERCMQVMDMNMPKSVLWQKVRRLKQVLPATG